MAPAAVDISYVIITWNDAGKLPAALRSAAEMAFSSGRSFEIRVVDNGSQDHTQEILAGFKEVLGERLIIYSLPKNRGTTVSRNLALRQALGRHICVMDSDTELLDPCWPQVSDLLDRFPQVGLVAPQIIMPDGSIWNSAKRFPTFYDKLMKLPHIFWGAPQVNHDWYPDFPFTRTRCVETVIACAWFFHREMLDLIGYLDERIFYAPEDLDWCLRLWEAGRAVVYLPQCRFLHHTRRITHNKPFSNIAMRYLWHQIYYHYKHRYFINRSGLVERLVRPLARRLDPQLRDWETEVG